MPAALRRALEARDRGCRFPGCGGRFADAHHIKHWADGGETKLSNLVLLCRRHHRRVHEDGWSVCSDPERGAQVVFFTPNGRALAAAPPLGERPAATGHEPARATSTRASEPAAAPTVSPLAGRSERRDSHPSGASTSPRPPSGRVLFERFLRALTERDVEPDWRTNLPRSAHGQPVPWPVESAAIEALGRSP